MGFLDVDGARLHYREWGAGPLTVLVHGLGLDHRLWEPLTQRLPDRRLVALDLRGYGHSDGVGGKDLTMERIADDVAHAVRSLGTDAADLVGFSMGGIALLALWERSPEVARSLALLAARANADTEEQRAGRDRHIASLLGEGRHRFATDFLPLLTWPDPDPLLAARLRDLLESVPYETLVACLRGLKQRPCRMAVLEHIRVPTLVAVGEGDAFVPRPFAEDMAARLPQGSLSVLDGAGHTTPLEDPDGLAATLQRFWASTGDRR
jgi:pimeloyl-ACP methyl ester carboxylesterase